MRMAEAVPARALEPGLEYHVDAAGTIVGVAWEAWERFARENGSAAMAERDRVLGRPLAAFIAGDEVRAHDCRLRRALLAGEREDASYYFRCDAPGERRLLLMTMRPALIGDQPLVHYRTFVCGRAAREPAPLLAVAYNPRLPPLTICSFCKDVRLGDLWVPVEEYYRRGGTDAVRLSHGICPPCMEEALERCG